MYSFSTLEAPSCRIHLVVGDRLPPSSCFFFFLLPWLCSIALVPQQRLLHLLMALAALLQCDGGRLGGGRQQQRADLTAEARQQATHLAPGAADALPEIHAAVCLRIAGGSWRTAGVVRGVGDGGCRG